MSEGNQPEVVLNEFGELSRKSRRELIAFGVDPDTAVIEHIRTQSIPVVLDSAPVSPPAPVATPALTVPPATPAAPVVPPAPAAPAAPPAPTAPAAPPAPAAPAVPPAPAPVSFSQLLQGDNDVRSAAPVMPVPVTPVPVMPVPVAAPPVMPPPTMASPATAASPQAAPTTEASVFSPSLSRRDMRNLRERSETTSEIPIIFDRADDETYDSLPQEVVVAEEILPPAPSGDVVDAVVVIDDETEPSSENAPQTIAEATAVTAISDAIASRRRSANRGDISIDRHEDSGEISGGFEQFSISTMSTQSTGVIPTTGSALILPTLPEHSPGAMASFSHTGEIYLTGSIALPSSMGHYGADFLSLDTSEIDVISEDDDIASNQDLAPIRASSAVSAYSTSNTVVTVPSKFKDRLPLVLAITAAGLAVGVVALFITGYVLGVF